MSVPKKPKPATQASVPKKLSIDLTSLTHDELLDLGKRVNEKLQQQVTEITDEDLKVIVNIQLQSKNHGTVAINNALTIEGFLMPGTLPTAPERFSHIFKLVAWDPTYARFMTIVNGVNKSGYPVPALPNTISHEQTTNQLEAPPGED